jgi:dTDP-4-dehydrorhamnose reductase
MIILQFALIAIFVYIFNESSVYFYYSTLVVAVITVIYIVNTNMIPEYKIAWITPILIFPIFGVPLYFMLGKKRFGKRKAKEYDKAYQINATGAKNLAELSLAYQFKLIHISTDFVFPGDKEIEKYENDETQPVNAYGKSKLEGEVFVNAIAKDPLILRVSWLYGPNGRNFVSIISQLIKTKDELNIVADQYGKTTYTVDVAEVLSHLITKQENGIYHFANQGVSSRYEFTQEIYRLIKEYEEVDCTIKPMKAIDYPDPTPRPSYSVLNTDKISQLIDKPRHWRSALSDYIDLIYSK